jgi:isopentenyl phosphate kinase
LKGHDAYIIKLGGSVITKKDKKYETDVETLCRIASYLSISKPSVIVHGGGSFGHYIVNEILQRKERLETVDLPHISHIMDRLSHEVIRCLIEKGIPAVSFPPHSLCTVIRGKMQCSLETLRRTVNRGLVPVTYGDSILSEDGIEIVSGDTLMVFIAKKLGIRKLVFLTDVDGVYQDLKSKKIVNHLVIKRNEPLPIKADESSHTDVTGGMKAKINSLRDLPPGSKVYILNGRNERQVYRVLIKDENPSTLIEVMD